MKTMFTSSLSLLLAAGGLQLAAQNAPATPGRR